MRVTRRQFLASSGVAALSLSLGRLAFSETDRGPGPNALNVQSYKSWEDLYR